MTRRWIALASLFALVAVGLLLLAAFGGGVGEPAPAPDVVGLRLDVAQDLVARAGLDWEVSGGGIFGVIVRSRWSVCGQEPAAGRTTTSVLLVVDRECPPRVGAPELVRPGLLDHRSTT